MPRLRLLALIAGALTILLPATALASSPRSDFAGSQTPAGVRADHHVHAAQVAPLAGLIGPDVSSWQGCALDWPTIAESSSFSFMKASEGTNWTDPCFALNWFGTGSLGMIRGAYHFARPHAPTSSAYAEASHYVSVVNAAGGFGAALPPVLDIETDRGLKRAALRTWIQKWVNKVRKLTHRRDVVIYTGAWFWNPHVGRWAPKHTLLWASGYTAVMPAVLGFKRAEWWQYTDGAHGPQPHSTPGVGAVDHSLWLGSAGRLRALARR